VSRETVLAEAVRRWVGELLPGRTEVMDRAARHATAAYRQGASVAEACEEVRALVGVGVGHPANEGAVDHVVVQLAS
jgi:hypothetical protein